MTGWLPGASSAIPWALIGPIPFCVLPLGAGPGYPSALIQAFRDAIPETSGSSPQPRKTL